VPLDRAFIDGLVARPVWPELDVSRFQCDTAIDWFLANVAREHHDNRITSVMCWLNDGDLTGYVTTSMHLLQIESPDVRRDVELKGIVRTENGKQVKFFPALLIGMLGVCTRYKRRGLGRYMVMHAIGQAKNLSRTTGCRFVAVDSDNTEEAMGLYKSVGFKVLESRKKDRKTIEMYFDLGPLHPPLPRPAE
jgi:ribosomal protein S18 acetylase RimI-like enzyme